MGESEPKYKVEHNEAAQRFEFREGDDLAVLDYRLQGGKRMALIHTGVPRKLEGQGIGSELVRTALNYARAQQLKILPLCSFVHVYLRRHPEFSDLV